MFENVLGVDLKPIHCCISHVFVQSTRTTNPIGRRFRVKSAQKMHFNFFFNSLATSRAMLAKELLLLLLSLMVLVVYMYTE